VPIYAATRDPSQSDIRVSLETLVRDFESDATAYRKLIRDIFDSDRGLFYSTAIDILKTSSDSRGAQYLIALIVADGLLLRALCEPELSRDQAIAVARAAVRVDPMADAMLARALADSVVGNSEAIADPARIMEVLSEIADSNRVLPSLMRLLRNSNPYLRSKVVKLIGKGSRSVKWVRAKLAENDPRVRANAVEALWGVDSPDARALLHSALTDGSNRVIGNALLGLYYLGDCAAMEELVKLSTHESNLCRATAAWVMGETGDVRFSDVVRRLLLESEPVVRKRALAALGRIKQATNSFADLPHFHVAGRIVSASKRNGSRRVMVAVAADWMKEPPKIAPLQFILSESNQYITSYRVAARPESEAISVIFIIPRAPDSEYRPFQDAALTCLKWKRPSDLWCVLPYLDSGDCGLSGHAQEMPAPQFTANIEAAQAMLIAPPKRIDCTDLWTAVWRATRSEVSARGQRHIFIFSRAPENRIAGHGLIASVQAGRYRVHAVSSVENPELQDFCNRTHSAFDLVAEEEFPDAIRQSYLSVLARYEVTYQPVTSQAGTLKIRVQSPEGCGETLLAIPAR
jgi:HEAT repeat protein